VRGWSVEQRRAAALRLHRDAVTSGCPRYFDRHPITVLAECGLELSRDDLLWSLHLLVDERPANRTTDVGIISNTTESTTHTGAAGTRPS
jgi:hypothetical protein